MSVKFKVGDRVTHCDSLFPGQGTVVAVETLLHLQNVKVEWDKDHGGFGGAVWVHGEHLALSLADAVVPSVAPRTLRWRQFDASDNSRTSWVVYTSAHPKLAKITQTLARLATKNDGRIEVTLRDPQYFTFDTPEWRPTFAQGVFATIEQAKVAVEECWHGPLEQ